jgi:hypothetical protein
MEIIAEIVFEILGWLFQFLGELVLQIVWEVVAELIGHGIKRPLLQRKPVEPWLAAIGYLVAGVLAGFLSLWIVPEVFVKAPWLRVANLLLTPVASGLIMAWIGTWRSRREKEVIRIETFSYGFLFAFSMALMRFTWGS